MHLSQIKFFILTVISIAVISCKEKPKQIDKDNIIAKVNKSVLTKEALINFTSSKRYSHKFQQEIINEWIEKELLYCEANDEGITRTNEFLELLNKSKKELASTFYLQKYFDNNLKQVTESEIQSYFIQNKEDYRLKDDAYIINKIKFDSFEKAEEFRNEAVSSSWIRAVNMFADKAVERSFQKNLFLFRHEIYPIKLLKSLEQLNKEEISNVVETGENEFSIVQLVDKLERESIPDFTVVKNDVSKRYYAKLKKDLYRKLLDKLTEKYEVEIIEENIK